VMVHSNTRAFVKAQIATTALSYQLFPHIKHNSLVRHKQLLGESWILLKKRFYTWASDCLSDMFY